MSFHHIFVPGPPSSRTLLLLHGTGGDENDLIPLGKTLDSEAKLLSIRGRIDEQGSNRFFRRFAEGVFDYENLHAEADALGTYLKELYKKHEIDAENTYVIGFSNGANMGATLAFKFPELLRGAFLMRAMFVYEPQRLPALGGLQVLLSSGETDPMVPIASAEQLATIFVQGGADVEHLWVSGGHQLTRQELQRAKEWLAAR